MEWCELHFIGKGLGSVGCTWHYDDIDDIDDDDTSANCVNDEAK